MSLINVKTMCNSVSELDTALKDLVKWSSVAIHLPGITKTEVDMIKVENPLSVSEQKLALYGEWLKRCHNPTWGDVITALEEADEIALADGVKSKVDWVDVNVVGHENGAKNFNPNVQVCETTISEKDIVKQLKELNMLFLRLVADIEERCADLVNNYQFDLNKLTLYLSHSRLPFSLRGIENVPSVHDLFILLDSHYNFLDCEFLELVVGQFPESTKLLLRVQEYLGNVECFKDSTLIGQLVDKLQPYRNLIHSAANRVMLVVKVPIQWASLTLSLLEKLIITLFPFLSNGGVQFYQIVSGCLCISFTIAKCHREALINHHPANLLHLFGIIRLEVDGITCYKTDDVTEKIPQSAISKAIKISCRLGCSEFFTTLLQYVPNCSNLYVYCAKNQLALVAEHIVQFIEDVNICSLPLGISPLMIACTCGHNEIVDCLIQAGANVNSVDKDGYSPLAYTIIASKSFLIVESLLKAGAKTNIMIEGKSLTQIVKNEHIGKDTSNTFVEHMALQLHELFSSTVIAMWCELSANTSTNEVLKTLKTKLMNDTEFRCIDGVSDSITLNELCIALKPHYDFLSWKIISLLSNCLKENNYFTFIQQFEENTTIESLPKVLSLVPRQDSHTSTQKFQTVTLVLPHKIWATKPLSSLRELNVILFSSLSRLMNSITVTVTEENIYVNYTVPLSANVTGRKNISAKLMYVLSILEILVDDKSNWSYSKTFINPKLVLHFACCIKSMPSNQLLKVIKFLFKFFESDFDTETRDEDGFTPLLLACSNNGSSIVEYLLQKSADPKISTLSGITPLMVASAYGYLDTATILINSSKASIINQVNNKGMTSLFFGILKFQTEIVKFLLKNGADPNICTNECISPLSIAASNGDIELVEVLIENGADVNIVSVNGLSPLFCSINEGHFEVCRLLIASKADYTHTIVEMEIPFDAFSLACSCGHSEIVSYLIQSTQQSLESLSIGWYAACLANKTHLIDYLIHSLPQVSGEIRELVIACANNDIHYMQENLSKKEVNIVHGVTPLMVACSCGHTPIVRLLVNNGANVTRVDNFGYTAASYSDDTNIQQLFGNPDVKIPKPSFQKNLYGHFDTDKNFNKGISSTFSGLLLQEPLQMI